MKITSLAIPEVLLIEPRLFEDARGFFYESFNRQKFVEIIGIDGDFVQDNHSSSKKNVLRGLHYQLPPKAQGKLVRVTAGEIFDVAVDIRRESPTFGQWVGYKLSVQNRMQLWIPPGFAHGFVVLSDNAEVLYKTTEYYAPELERCIRWNDESLNISWPVREAPVVSEKDASAQGMEW